MSTVDDIDDILRKANGDISIIEKELGITPPGSWQGKNGIYRVDIVNPENFNLRISSGNEVGANPLWEPGGWTSGGRREAVTDAIPNTPTNVKPNKILN